VTGNGCNCMFTPPYYFMRVMGKLYLYLYHEISYHSLFLRVYSAQVVSMQLNFLLDMYISVSWDMFLLKN
jgi:hypothetical protein